MTDTLVAAIITGSAGLSAAVIGLLIAPKGTEVIVIGKIVRLDSTSSTLEDCKYEIPQKAA